MVGRAIFISDVAACERGSGLLGGLEVVRSESWRVELLSRGLWIVNLGSWSGVIA